MTSPTDTLTLVTVPSCFGQHRDLHLHGLEEYHGVALADLVAFVDDDFEHAGHNLRANILGHLHPTLQS